MNPPGDTPAGRASTRILLLRHAETSAPDRFHGCESDIGLSERGREQARRVAPIIAAESPAAVYCSGLRRAGETAEPIARACGGEPRIVAALHERCMGPLSNTPREQTWPVYEETRRRWAAGDLNHTHDGGESYAAIRDRVVPVFNELAARHRGQTIAVVAHGVVIRVLLCSVVEGLGPAAFGELPIDFLRIYRLEHQGGIVRLQPSGPPEPPGGSDPTPW